MTRDQLEHAIRAACDVSGDDELWVFGSQAILGQFPEAPRAVLASIEVDMQPKNKPGAVDEIDGALGELSLFHDTHGFYVHGVSIESAILPDGWERRAVPVRNHATRDFTGWCLEAHDLAASKLAAYRDKDRDFVRVLLTEQLIDASTLQKRLEALPTASMERDRAEKWLAATARDL